MSDSCDPMDCSLPGLLCLWDSPGKNTGVGRHFLLQGIFPTQESNPGLQHCRQILYRLGWRGGYKNKKANRTGWTKSGMIKINGGSNWDPFCHGSLALAGSQQSHEILGMHHTELISERIYHIELIC